MKEVKKLSEELTQLWNDFALNNEKFMNGNKSAGGRARKAIGAMRKLTTAYRKSTIEAAKSL